MYTAAVLSMALAISAGFAQQGNETTPSCPATLKRNTLASNGVLLDVGGLAVWGQDTPGFSRSPIGYVSVDAGYDFACALTSNGYLFCWGTDHLGQLRVPAAVQGSVSSFSCGMSGSYVCALTFGGDISCWGGYGGSKLSVPGGYKWRAVTAGHQVACGITTGGSILCWGDNSANEVGGVPGGTNWIKVSAGNQDVCGVASDGGFNCWGRCFYACPNVPGGLNSGNYVWLQNGIQATVIIGYRSICSLDTSGNMVCQGTNINNQNNLPNMGSAPWRYLSVSDSNSCGIDAFRTLRCSGQTTFSDATRPWSTVSARSSSTVVCATDILGGATCWNLASPIAPALVPATLQKCVIYSSLGLFAPIFASANHLDGTVSMLPSNQNDAVQSTLSFAACTQLAIGLTLGVCYVSPQVHIFNFSASGAGAPRSGVAVALMQKKKSTTGTLLDIQCSVDSCCWIDSGSNLTCSGFLEGALTGGEMQSSRVALLPACGIVLQPNGSLASFDVSFFVSACASIVRRALPSVFLEISADVSTNATAVACAITTNHSVVCWSAFGVGDASGRLDVPSTVAASSSVSRVWVVGGTACAKLISVASSIVCWGFKAADFASQYSAAFLMDNTISPARLSPQGICITTKNCAGVGGLSCLGVLPSSSRSDSSNVLSLLPSSPTQLALSHSHGCARSDALDVVCWGADDQIQVSGSPLKARTASVAQGSSCFVSFAEQSVVINCTGRTFPATLIYGNGSNICDAVISPSSIFIADGTKESVWNLTTASFTRIEGGAGASRLGGRSDGVFGVSPAQCTLDATGIASCPGMPAAYAAIEFVDICSGAYHTCGLAVNGTLACWGSYLQSPSQWSSAAIGYPRAPFPFFDLSCGDRHSCAINANRDVVCWGDASAGPDAKPNIIPRFVSNDTVFVQGLSADSMCLHTLSLSAVSCFSKGGSGLPSKTQQYGPQGGNIGAAVARLGLAVGCYVGSTDSFLVCWGDGFAWRPSSTPTPTALLFPSPTSASFLAISYQHACAILPTPLTSTLRCWGDPDFGRFNATLPIMTLPWNLAAVSLGFAHSCVVQEGSRAVWCWGGSGNATISSPVNLLLSNGSVAGPFETSPTSVCSGRSFFCGIDAAILPSIARCFDAAENFQEITSTLPLTVSGIGSGGVSRIACGEYHICSIVQESLSCTSISPELAPPGVLAVPPGNAWRDVVCGQGHTCGISTGDMLFCWGDVSWQQGPARIVSKSPLSASADSSVLVGVLGASDASCISNRSCATLAQAAKLSGDQVHFYIVGNITLDEQAIFSPLCDRCSVSPHPNATRPIWVSILLPVSASKGGNTPACAIMVQSTLTIANLTFLFDPQPMLGNGTFLFASLILVSSTSKDSSATLSDVVFRSSVTGNSQNATAFTALLRAQTSGALHLNAIKLVGPGTSTYRFVDVSSASAVSFSDIFVDGRGDVAPFGEPWPFVSITGGVYRVQASSMTFLGRNTPLAPIFSSIGNTFTAFSLISISSSSFSSLVSTSSTLSTTIFAANILNSSFLSIMHAPFNGLDSGVASTFSVVSSVARNCIIGGPNFKLAAPTVNGSEVLGVFFNRPMFSLTKNSPLDAIALSNNTVAYTFVGTLVFARIAAISSNTSFASLSVGPFVANSSPFDFLVCLQLAFQSLHAGFATSFVTISGASQPAPTSMRLLSVTPALASLFPPTWQQPDVSVFLFGIAWHWQRPIIMDLQIAIAFDSSVIILLDVPTAKFAASDVFVNGHNSTAFSFAPACGLFCISTLPPSLPFSYGTYTFDNVQLGGGYALAGGALFWRSPLQSTSFALSIASSSFSNSVSNGTVGGGGAFFSSAARNVAIAIRNTSFPSNFAFGGSGGAVHITQTGDTDRNGLFILNVSTSVVSGGIATGTAGGGGIFVASSASSVSVIVTGSTIERCSSSSGSGGGVVLFAKSGIANLSIANSIFAQNSAIKNGGGLSVAVNDFSVSLNLTSNSFISNSASESGGGIFIAATTITREKVVVVNATHTNNAFWGNRASGNGGAVAYQHDGILRVVAVDDAYVSNAALGDAGGGAFWHGASKAQFFTALLELTNVTLTSNAASYSGGAFFTTSASLVASGISSFNNSAGPSTNGGSIHMLGGTASISDSQFVGDFAGGGGGSLALFTSASPHSISNSSFVRSVAAAGDGGCVLIDSSTMVITNGSFLQCSAGGDGGAVAMRGNSNVTVDGALFKASSAGTKGGCISSVGSIALSLSKTDLSFCTAGISGGGVSIENSQPGSFHSIGPNISISNCAALNKDISTFGGGLHLSSIPATSISFVESVSILECFASYGGGIALLGTPLPDSLNNASFICSNVASIAGGGLFSDDASFVPPGALANNSASACNKALTYSNNSATPPKSVIALSASPLSSSILPFSPTPQVIFSLAVVDNFGGIVSKGTSFTCLASATNHKDASPIFLRNASTFLSFNGVVDILWVGFQAPSNTVVDVQATCTLQVNSIATLQFRFTRTIKLATLFLEPVSSIPSAYIPSMPSAPWEVGNSPIQLALVASSGIAGDSSVVKDSIACTLIPTSLDFVVYSVSPLYGTSVFAGGFASPAKSSIVSIPPFGIQTSLFASLTLIISCYRPSVNDPPVLLSINLSAVDYLKASFVEGASPQAAAELQTSLSDFSVSVLTPSARAADGFPQIVCVATGSPVGDIDRSSASIARPNPISINGIVPVNLSSGVATFRNFVLSAETGVYELSVRCSIGSILVPPALSSILSISGCASGLFPSGSQCATCGFGNFTIGGAGVSMECVRCPPQGATCNTGIISLSANFYRPPQQDGLALGPNTELHACLNGEACTLIPPTNMTNAIYGCATGYTGPLCGVCDTANNYALFGQICTTCWPVWQSSLLLACLVVFILGMLAYIALKPRGDTVSTATAPNQASSSPAPSSSDASIALRITMNYLQAIGSLKTFVSGGTAAYRNLMGWTDTISSSPLSSGALDCALSHPSFFQKFLVSIFMPFILTAIVVAIYIFYEALRAVRDALLVLCSKKRFEAPVFPATQTTRPNVLLHQQQQAVSRRSLNLTAAAPAMRDAAVGDVADSSANPIYLASNLLGAPAPPSTFFSRTKLWIAERRHVSTFVLFLSLLYMAMTSSSFRALDCMSNEPIYGIVYLREDLRVTCFTGAHAVAVIFAYITLLFVGIGFPLGFFVLLSRVSTEQLDDSTFRAAYGFLFRGYRTSSDVLAPSTPSTDDGSERGRRISLSSSARTTDGVPFSSQSQPPPQSGPLKIPTRPKDLIFGHFLWWEAVVITRKAGVVLLSVLVTNAYLQNAGAALWFAGALSLQLYVQPYKKKLFNFLEAVSLVASFTTAVIASTLLQYDVKNPTFVTQAPNSMTQLEWAITGVLVVINFGATALMGCTWLWLLFGSAMSAAADRCGCLGCGDSLQCAGIKRVFCSTQRRLLGLSSPAVPPQEPVMATVNNGIIRRSSKRDFDVSAAPLTSSVTGESVSRQALLPSTKLLLDSIGSSSTRALPVKFVETSLNPTGNPMFIPDPAVTSTNRLAAEVQKPASFSTTSSFPPASTPPDTPRSSIGTEITPRVRSRRSIVGVASSFEPDAGLRTSSKKTESLVDDTFLPAGTSAVDAWE